MADSSSGVAADAPDLTEAERAELERLRTFQEVWVTPLLAELQQLRAEHVALLALANELDGPNEALAAAARMLRETLGAETSDG